MTTLKQIYKCSICGNMVDVIHSAGGTLVCCNQPMNLVIENTVEASLEKHIPIIEKTEDGVLVKVGAVEHPMTLEHHIEWIEIHTQAKVYRKYLTPDEKPEALFLVHEDVIAVREYCNIHGLWKA